MKSYILPILIMISVCCRSTDSNLYTGAAEDKDEISFPQFEENFGKQVGEAREQVYKYEDLLQKYQQGWTAALDQRDEYQVKLQEKTEEAKQTAQKLSDALKELKDTQRDLRVRNAERDHYAAEMEKYRTLWKDACEIIETQRKEIRAWEKKYNELREKYQDLLRRTHKIPTS